MGISACTQRNKGRSKRANWIGPLSKSANISSHQKEKGVTKYSKIERILSKKLKIFRKYN